MAKAHCAAQLATGRQVDQRARYRGRRANRNRCRAHHRVVQFAHRQGPHQQIHVLRLDHLAARRHVLCRACNKGHFRGVLTLGSVVQMSNQTHAQRTVCPNGFEQRQCFRVAVDVVLQLRAGVTHITRIDENRRNARIDHGHIQRAHTRHF